MLASLDKQPSVLYNRSVKVHILDHHSAKNFIPETPTLAIRIYDSPSIDDGNTPDGNLQKSSLWLDTLEYVFDDLDLSRYSAEYIAQHLTDWENQFVLFSEKLAQQLLTDFAPYCTADQVMVHCTWGWARSPATILGLRDVFGLDIKWAPGRTQKVVDARKAMGSTGNDFVYQTITQAA